ncbi:MAG: DUF2752 domain-containing protein [Verrucomicrobiota bacterium]|nr:DUF2752 domain-containing protein [Verrucomicrobiota bacterium]MDE3066305.1 DUF2752 domain-containing protein [Verrucomicrobiota bacterium]
MRAETPRAVPPRISASRPLRRFAAATLVAALLGGGAVLYLFNPSKHGFYPVCEFHEMTGLNCPGCGSTRAAYALLHGRLTVALRDNALFVLSLAGLAAWSVRSAWRKWRNLPAALDLSPKVLWAFLVAALVFTVLRNLPAFAWLSP